MLAAIHEIELENRREAAGRMRKVMRNVPRTLPSQTTTASPRTPRAAGLRSLEDDDVDGLSEPQQGSILETVNEGFRAALAQGSVKLPGERVPLVMSLYYDQELNLKEIGVVLNVTESRVCQLNGQALVRAEGPLG